MSESTGTHRVEFVRHPDLDAPHLLTWGIRIDGTDLRVLVAQVTRASWALELDEDDDTPREREEFLVRQHAPLYLGEEDERAHAHFLGGTEPYVHDPDTGALCLLGCHCGIPACWPLLAEVCVTATEVTWSGFRQPERPEWGELPLGPYVFPRPAYEAALTTPTVLTRDPLAPLPGAG
ncbi:hypothetical protein [Streptomyces sp. SGAir0957]